MNNGELVRALQERAEPVAGDVDRRFVPGVEQQDAGGDQLVVGDLAAVVVLNAQQVGNQIVTAVVAPGGRELS